GGGLVRADRNRPREHAAGRDRTARDGRRTVAGFTHIARGRVAGADDRGRLLGSWERPAPPLAAASPRGRTDRAPRQLARPRTRRRAPGASTNCSASSARPSTSGGAMRSVVAPSL